MFVCLGAHRTNRYQLLLDGIGTDNTSSRYGFFLVCLPECMPDIKFWQIMNRKNKLSY